MCDLDLTPFDLNIHAIKTKFTIHVITSQVSFQQKVIWILSFGEQPAGWPWPLTMWPQNIWWKIRVGFDIWQCEVKMTTLFTKRGYLLHESRNLTVTKWNKGLHLYYQMGLRILDQLEMCSLLGWRVWLTATHRHLHHHNYHVSQLLPPVFDCWFYED